MESAPITYTTTGAANLKQRWEQFRMQNPKIRIRDAAKQLGTTEAELVATGLGTSATALQPQFASLLQEIHTLGYVMALTRNDYVVHERKGVYLNPSFNAHVGLFVGEDIDLRLFMQNWKFGFAVSEGDRHSLQFFGKDGEAIHKIYLTDKSDKNAFDALIAKYKAQDQNVFPEVTPPAVRTTTFAGLDDTSKAAFQDAWVNLRDTHDFFGLLQKFGIPRREAMYLAPEGLAYRVTASAVRKVLEAAAASELPVMVFVGNKGCIQIHTGPVKKLFETGPWYNVMDPEFNLHLREDAIDEVWVVIKPTTDGVVTALEVFDKEGDMIVQLFGKRKPGVPEMEAWRRLVREQATPLS